MIADESVIVSADMVDDREIPPTRIHRLAVGRKAKHGILFVYGQPAQPLVDRKQAKHAFQQKCDQAERQEYRDSSEPDLSPGISLSPTLPQQDFAALELAMIHTLGRTSCTWQYVEGSPTTIAPASECLTCSEQGLVSCRATALPCDDETGVRATGSTVHIGYWWPAQCRSALP